MVRQQAEDEASPFRVRAVLRAAMRSELGFVTEPPAVDSRPRLLAPDLQLIVSMGLVPLFTSRSDCFRADQRFRDQLSRVRKRQFSISLRQASSAWSLQRLLSDRGIRSLTYKGVALSIQTTGELTGRAPGDLDLLVELSDVPAVHQLLAQEGWSPDEFKLPATGERGWRVVPLLTCETTYRGREPSVDLHWRLEPTQRNFRVSFDELWDNRASAVAGGIELITLGEADALLLTAAHGTRERWVSWRWAVDAARQFAGWGADPAELIDRATDIGAGRALAIAGAMTDRMLGRAVSERGGTLDSRRLARIADDAWSHPGVVAGMNRRLAALDAPRRQSWRIWGADSPMATLVSVAAPAGRRLVNSVI